MSAGAAATPVLEVQVLNDEMTKPEIEAHVQKHHLRPHYIGSKSAKAEIIKWHNNLHTRIEQGGPDLPQYSRLVRGEHVHRAISAEQFAREGGLVLDLVKPLTSSEANALKEAINNDFAALANDMRAMAADAKQQRIAEVTKEWDRKKDRSSEYAAKANALVQRFREDRDALVAKALTDGVELGMASIREVSTVTSLVGRAQAIQSVQTEVTNDLNRALLALERQKLAAQRTVLLARVTPEAQKVLDQVPDAKTLMVQAAQERAMKAVEA